ncbi:hypothetical protein GCM10011579_057840 [Streptomyces albiflavescens]|uniref:Uncharacterized protein n=1 Tax=Streptomyces albiflavescens TaxID=1623582 RepID=A0A917YA52_9ACTN|nr:hypothetical protein GCM10011579_057840 [Streptomyces albiflavescens]
MEWVGGALLPDGVYERAGQAWGDDGVTGGHDADGCGQFLWFRVVDEKSAGSGAQGSVGVSLLADCGHNQYARGAMFGLGGFRGAGEA